LAIFDYFRRGETKQKDNIINNQSGFRQYPATSEEYIPMETIMRYYESSPRLSITVDTNTNYAVGDGYFLKAKDDTKPAKSNFAAISEYCKDIHMEELARNITLEMMACGNAFLFRDSDGSITHFPARQVTEIYHQDGIPEEYRIIHQSNGIYDFSQTEESISPDEIIHFSRNRIPGSPWGRGIGHRYCARGVGYRNSKNKLVQRVSLAQIDEMLEDAFSHLAARGLPRFLISGADMRKAGTDLHQAMDQMDIGEHFIIDGADVKLDTMELGSRASWTDFLMRLDHACAWAMQSPVATLFASPDKFAYASSKEAAALMFPGIDSYQRLFKEFIEREIFAPYLNVNGKYTWDNAPVEIRWGSEETTDLDKIEQVFNMKRNGLNVTSESIIKLIQQGGIPVEVPKASAMSPTMQARAMKRQQPLNKTASLEGKLHRYMDNLNGDRESETESKRDAN